MPVELNPRNAWDMVLQTHLDSEGALNWRVVGKQYIGPQERKYLVEVDSWAQSSSFAEAPSGFWRYIVWSDCGTRSCVTLDRGMAYQRTFLLHGITLLFGKARLLGVLTPINRASIALRFALV